LIMASNPFETHEIKEIAEPIPPREVADWGWGEVSVGGVVLIAMTLVVFYRRRIFGWIRHLFFSSKPDARKQWARRVRHYQQKNGDSEVENIDEWWSDFVAILDQTFEIEGHYWTREEWTDWAEQRESFSQIWTKRFSKLLLEMDRVKYAQPSESHGAQSPIELMIECIETLDSALENE